MSKLHINALKQAFESLKSGYEDRPSEIVRDGIIQRFEFTIEQCWKNAKKVLSENSVEADTPKNIFREMANLGWIDSAEPWFLYLRARNLTSHIYKQEVAEEVFKVIKDFMRDTQTLIDVLETKLV